MKPDKRLAIVAVLLFCIAPFVRADSYDKLADELAETAALLKQPKIAIMAFNYLDKRKSDGGVIVAERLTTRIVKLKKFQVIERHLLENVLQELHLESTGVVDAETTKQLGKVLGVEAIIAGTLLDVENGQVEINARVIKTDTAEVIGTASVEIEKIWQDAGTAQPQQQEHQTQEYSKPSFSEPKRYAPDPQVDTFFDLLAGNSGSGKATVSFSNYTYGVSEDDLGIGGSASSVKYSQISIKDALTENNGTPFGLRLAGFGKHFGGDIEIFNFSQVISKQTTAMTLDSKNTTITTYKNDYLKVTSFAILSGDLLLRFSSSWFQPYIGAGIGMTLNNTSSPYVYAYSGGTSWGQNFNEESIGFIFKVPVGVRIVMGKDASIFAEYRSIYNSYGFTRGITSEDDSVTLTANYMLFGAGIKF